MGLEQEVTFAARSPRRRSSRKGTAALALSLLALASAVVFHAKGTRASPDSPREAPIARVPAAAPAPVARPPVERQAAPEQVIPVSPEGCCSRGKIPGGALSAVATLGQAKLVKNGDGEVLLHVGVDATDEAGKKDRRPIDFALVLDVSGSMEDENKIGLLKTAARGLLERLDAEDRVAVVAFSNDARTVFPLSPLDAAARRRFTLAVDALEASGGTNLSAGLLAGADELRRAELRAGSARRIVLMTDGLANFGVQEPRELCRLVNDLAREGFTITTVGLGLEYGEKLLSEMADAGGGNFHDARTGDRLARIYELEVEATRALVARDARLVVSTSPGVAVESVYLWPSSSGEKETTVSLGDLSAGRHLKAVLRLKVPTGSDAAAFSVASVSLRYDDVRGKKAERVATPAVPLGVELVADREVAKASTASEVRKELDEVAVGDALKRAHEAALAGKTEEVRVCLATIRDRTGSDCVKWRNRDGVEETLRLETVAAVATRIAMSKDRTCDDADNALLKRCASAVVPIGK